MKYGEVDPVSLPAPHTQPPAGVSATTADDTPWYQHTAPVYLLLVIFCPVGLYGLWKNTLFSSKKKWVLTGLTLLLWSVYGGAGSSNGGGGGGGGGGEGNCAATYYQNGCTYYRDSNCNVVAQDCE